MALRKRERLAAFPPGAPPRRVSRFDAWPGSGLRYTVTERAIGRPELGWTVFDIERQRTVRTYRWSFAYRRAMRRFRKLNGCW